MISRVQQSFLRSGSDQNFGREFKFELDRSAPELATGKRKEGATPSLFSNANLLPELLPEIARGYSSGCS